MNSKVERQTELAEGSSSFLEVVRPTAYQLFDLLAKLLLVLVWIVFEHIIFSDFLSISDQIRSCHIISYHMFVFRNVVTVCLDDLLIAACQECGVKTSAKNEPSCSVAFSLTGTKSCHARIFQKQAFGPFGPFGPFGCGYKSLKC